MPEPARPVSTADDFPGILTNVDQRDAPVGAAEEQVNLTSMLIGELTSRQGIREVMFEE